MYNEVEGNLLTQAEEGKFDVIIQGNNCMNVQGAGLAPQFVKAFGTDKFKMEHSEYKGDINKLGTIDFQKKYFEQRDENIYKWTSYPMWEVSYVFVVNCYTQFNYGSNHADGDAKPVDYDAIKMVMRKLNHKFKGLRIGMPKIGAGLAGGDWNKIKAIIQKEIVDCDVTVVIYKSN
jgi:O-acetyl-ADP-ribose deacetylase (regulator of RNase III)